ncbi:hypothetical protein DPEC_G00262440 [Dallia pectoralis]|uniref:Uncharacterized protein n=1 Tax=Dallia pectoralis TaxID=75939 RepID=A0ACC2FRU7_DALPE|nr:hypothetical protein DPEC_G00262440 [Dallia pectoralis]
MASTTCSWIALFFLAVTNTFTGIQCRAVRELQLKSSGFLDGHQTLRTDIPRRLRRESVETQRPQCAQLAAPWVETNSAPKELAQLHRLRVLSMPQGSRHAVFPEQPLFRFVRRVYHCCQLGFHCRGVKGIQGRISGGTEVEFLLSLDVLSVTVTRAEIHIHVSNPQKLNIEPVLPYMAKRKLPTRYSLGMKENILELRVDLLFLFQGLQEAAGGARGGPSLVHMRKVGELSSGGPQGRPGAPWSLQDTNADMWGKGLTSLLTTVELGLALNCDRGGVEVSCEHNGVHLLHSPFIALSYR